jgi:hypothetical protein
MLSLFGVAALLFTAAFSDALPPLQNGSTSPRHIGSTRHTVGGRQVTLHHYAAAGNHKSANDLRGAHRVGSLQGKKTVHFDLHHNNGRFSVVANGSSRGVRAAHVTTVKGDRSMHSRPHPSAGIASNLGGGANDLATEGTEATQFVGLSTAPIGDEEFVLQGGFATITLFFQIGVDGFGNPIFANVSFQMDLGTLLALLGNGPGLDPNDPLDPNAI